MSEKSFSGKWRILFSGESSDVSSAIGRVLTEKHIDFRTKAHTKLLQSLQEEQIPSRLPVRAKTIGTNLVDMIEIKVREKDFGAAQEAVSAFNNSLKP